MRMGVAVDVEVRWAAEVDRSVASDREREMSLSVLSGSTRESRGERATPDPARGRT